MITITHTPNKSLNKISQNTLDIIKGVQDRFNTSEKAISPYNTPSLPNSISFHEALASNQFTSIGMGLYKGAYKDEDYGRIWVRKSFTNEAGEKEDWLVAYEDDEGNLIRQIASEELQGMRKAANLKKKADYYLGDKGIEEIGFGDGDNEGEIMFGITVDQDKQDSVITIAESLGLDFDGTGMIVNDFNTIDLYFVAETEEQKENFKKVIKSKGIKLSSLQKQSYDLEAFKKYPQYKKYFLKLQDLIDVFMYGKPMVISKGTEYLMQQFPELDEIEAQKILNIWLGEVNPFEGYYSGGNGSSMANKTAADVKPENIPIAPGIKSKNLSLDESGGAGTGTVTVEFTDVDKALDFYQNDVSSGGEVKETPKEEEEIPQNEEVQQAPPPAQQPAQQPLPQVQPKASNKRAGYDDSYYNENNVQDAFGQNLYEGERVKNNKGERGTIQQINDMDDIVWVKYDGEIYPRKERAQFLTKWANTTVGTFSRDGVKGTKVYRYSKGNKYLTANTWRYVFNKLANNDESVKKVIKYSFVNEEGVEIPLKLQNSIKVGEMFERPDNRELIRFAGFIDKKAEDDPLFDPGVNYDETMDNEIQDYIHEMILENKSGEEIVDRVTSIYGIPRDKAVIMYHKCLTKMSSKTAATLDISVDAEDNVISDILDNILDNVDLEEETSEGNEYGEGINDWGDEEEDKLPGGYADDMSDDEFDPEQLEKGIEEEEKEHTDDEDIAKEIAEDHLVEDENYYDKLDKMEEKENSEEKDEEEDTDKESSKKTAAKDGDKIYFKINNSIAEVYYSGNMWVEGNIMEGEEPIGWGTKTYPGALAPEDLVLPLSQNYGNAELSYYDYRDDSDVFSSKREAKSPPGRKHEVEKLKETGMPEEEAFGIAWKQHKEHGKPKKKSNLNKLAFDDMNPMDLDEPEDDFNDDWDVSENTDLTNLEDESSMFEIYPYTVAHDSSDNSYSVYNQETGETEFAGFGDEGKREAENMIIRKTSSKTAADISDEIPPMSLTTDESQSDTIDNPQQQRQVQQPLPPKPSLNNEPGDVLYDSTKNEGGGNKFQVTTDPSEKTVTVKFLEDEQNKMLDQAINEGAGAPLQQQPIQNQQPLVQNPPQKNFEDTNSQVNF